MGTLTIEFIQQSTASGFYEISLHADEERLDEGLTVDDLEEVVKSVELLEDYPDDPRGHSCLVLGYIDRRPVHVVCGLTKQDKLILITVYRPTMPKWKDERTRNK
ncbi:MAG: DUF4258 domain-containing protein [Candidatus Latescibacteria bacterium]|nr:DUF4258 domain-containing protein [Candidatus Latescibacterota bacterium]